MQIHIFPMPPVTVARSHLWKLSAPFRLERQNLTHSRVRQYRSWLLINHLYGDSLLSRPYIILRKSHNFAQRKVTHLKSYVPYLCRPSSDLESCPKMSTNTSSTTKKRGAPSPPPDARAPANKKAALYEAKTHHKLALGKWVKPSFFFKVFCLNMVILITEHRSIVMNAIAHTRMKNRIKLLALESRFHAFIPDSEAAERVAAARRSFCTEKMVIFNVSVAKSN